MVSVTIIIVLVSLCRSFQLFCICISGRVLKGEVSIRQHGRFLVHVRFHVKNNEGLSKNKHVRLLLFVFLPNLYFGSLRLSL